MEAKDASLPSGFFHCFRHFFEKKLARMKYIYYICIGCQGDSTLFYLLTY